MDEVKRIVGLLLAMALVGAGFVLLLAIGFTVQGPDLLGVTDKIVPAAIVMCLAAVGLVLLIRSYRGRPAAPFRRWGRVVAHVPPPNAAQAAYLADRAHLATCVHLQPIERDMRTAGIRVMLRHGSVVEAICIIDEDMLRTRYDLAPPLRYIGDFPGDRPGDPESALLSCLEHQSVIGVVHPDDARPGTPHFPAA